MASNTPPPEMQIQLGLVGVRDVVLRNPEDAFPAGGLRVVTGTARVQRPFDLRQFCFQQFITATDSSPVTQMVAASNSTALDTSLVAAYTVDDLDLNAFEVAHVEPGTPLPCALLQEKLSSRRLAIRDSLTLDFLVGDKIRRMGALSHWTPTFPVSYKVTIAAQVVGSRIDEKYDPAE